MHENFSNIYDDFTRHVDYNSWYKFLRRYIKKKDSLLDIGCGTATLTKYFVNDNFEVTGLDISKTMIDIAKNKVNISYVCQDILEKPLKQKFKYITCNFDTVNYLKNFDKFIKHCSLMQDKGATLIFDIITEDIFDEIFENNLFVDEESSYTAIWTHKKLKKNHKIDISIYIKKENNIYERYDESHYKYIYDMPYIIEILNKYGYTLYDVAKNDKFGQARIFLIAKK